MKNTLDPTRWAQIESLPLPTGVGNLDQGLCAMARIGYALTGEVTDAPPCIAPTIRSYMISLNDSLPSDMRQKIGTREIAQLALDADSSPEAEQRRAFLCANQAVRVSAVAALRSVGLNEQAQKLADLDPIVDKETALKAKDAADAAYAGAAARAADAADAAAAAAADAARAKSKTFTRALWDAALVHLDALIALTPLPEAI